MNDTISRQQAIAALRALSDDDGYINAPHEVVTDVVRGLPPVRAEHEQTTQSEQCDSDKFGVKTGKTCEDCISRQAAIDEVRSYYDEIYCEPDPLSIEERIEALPSVQPERKTGKWYKPVGMMPPEYTGVYRCSECDEIAMRDWKHHRQELSNFCPNCGADMRGEQG